MAISEYIKPGKNEITFGKHIRDALKCGVNASKEGTKFIHLKGCNKTESVNTAKAVIYGYTYASDTEQSLAQIKDKEAEENVKKESRESDKISQKDSKDDHIKSVNDELDKLFGAMLASDYSSINSNFDSMDAEESKKTKNNKNEENITEEGKEADKQKIKYVLIEANANEDKENNKYLDVDLDYGEIELADGVIIIGQIDAEVEDMFLHLLKRVNERSKKALICVAVDGLSDRVKNKMAFEYNAHTQKVSMPSLDFYKNMFEKALSERKVKLAEKEKLEDVILYMQNYRLQDFSIQDYEKFIEHAKKNANKCNRKILYVSDFYYEGSNCENPESKLNALVGMCKIKEKIQKLVDYRFFNFKRQNEVTRPHHIAFAGNPGTGKTVVAKTYAEILTRNGMSNGYFEAAVKSTYIGVHVGETAKQMANLFKRARGGVIFFDEAGAFLTNDVYTQEAITELVRFMEMYPETTCIFASYKSKIEEFINKDEGIKSRIADVIIFEDYSNEELYQILEKMAKDENFELEESKQIFYDFINEQRKTNAEGFGNARLVRNIYDLIIQCIATQTRIDNEDPEKITTISTRILEKALNEYKENSIDRSKNSNRIGFFAS